MDVGIIDVNTCEPMPNVLVDLWHANTTGHYAGHPDQDPVLKWEGPATEGPRKGLLSKYPRTNDHETFLRGAWPTNENGLAQFSCASEAFPHFSPLSSLHTFHVVREPFADRGFLHIRHSHLPGLLHRPCYSRPPPRPHRVGTAQERHVQVPPHAPHRPALCARLDQHAGR